MAPPRLLLKMIARAIAGCANQSYKANSRAGATILHQSKAQRQKRDHVERQIVRIAEQAADGARDAAIFNEIDPSGVVDHRSDRDVGRAGYDQREQPIEPCTRSDGVHHQRKDQDHFAVEIDEHADSPARPYRKRSREDHHRTESGDPPELATDRHRRQPAPHSRDDECGERKQRGQVSKVHDVQKG